MMGSESATKCELCGGCRKIQVEAWHKKGARFVIDCPECSTTSTAAKDAEIARLREVERSGKALRTLFDHALTHPDYPSDQLAREELAAHFEDFDKALPQPPQTAPDDVVALLREAGAIISELLAPLDRAAAELVKHGKCPDENAEAALDRAHSIKARIDTALAKSPDDS